MSMFKRVVATTVAITMLSSSALAAEAIRPSVSLTATPGVSPPIKAGTRLGGGVRQKNDLLGAPLFFVFLGAVAITIGTIIIVNNNNNPSSSG